jgi:hypothetical protein
MQDHLEIFNGQRIFQLLRVARSNDRLIWLNTTSSAVQVLSQPIHGTYGAVIYPGLTQSGEGHEVALL